MAYQVCYDEMKVYIKGMRPDRKRKIFAGICLVLVILFFLGNLWEVQQIQRFIFPGDREALDGALETLVQMLRDGEEISVALSGFCREVIGVADETVFH